MNNPYTYLFEDLFDDFKQTTILTKFYDNIKKIFIFFIFLSAIINLIFLFFKINIFINIITNSLICIIVLILTSLSLSKINKKQNDIIDTFKGDLDKLLKLKPYKRINTLTKLEELEKFLLQKQTTTLLSHKNSKSIFLSIGILISNLLFSFIINGILTENLKFNLIVFIILIITSVLLFTIYLVTTTLFQLSYKNDQEYINLLLILVREKRMEILDSKSDNIIKKIKYLLKYDEFS